MGIVSRRYLKCRRCQTTANAEHINAERRHCFPLLMAEVWFVFLCCVFGTMHWLLSPCNVILAEMELGVFPMLFCLVNQLHPSSNRSQSRSSVGRALRFVWWEFAFRLAKSWVRDATGARCLWASWRVWLRLVAGLGQAKSMKGSAVRGYVCTNIRLWIMP